MKKYSVIILILGIVLFTACDAITGEEIGRIPINQVSVDDNDLIVKETSLDLMKDQVIAIWSDMDMEYEGDVALIFKIEIVKDGEVVKYLEIDPTKKNITIGEVKTNMMGNVKWSFTGKNSQIKIEEDGNYTFRGILVASENESLILNKAEIVLKK